MDFNQLLSMMNDTWKTVKPVMQKATLQLLSFVAKHSLVAVARFVILAVSFLYLLLPTLLTLPFAWVTSVICMLTMLVVGGLNLMNGAYDNAKSFLLSSLALFVGITMPLPFVNLRVLSVLSLAAISTLLVSVSKKCQLEGISEAKSLDAFNNLKVSEITSIHSLQNAFTEIVLGNELNAS